MLKQRFWLLLSLLRNAMSLTGNPPGTSSVIFRSIYEENVRSATPSTYMKTEEIPNSLMGLIKERGIRLKALPSNPYWQMDKHYSLLEVFGTLIQFTDSNQTPLPKSVFPSEQDVEKFIASVKSTTGPVTLRDQLTIALDITSNDILGAINLCWISMRLMARGADQRAYPNVFVDEAELRRWNQQISRFELIGESEKNDGPGDNYYFWTSVFAIIAFSSGGFMGKVAQLIFARGTKIMTFVRNRIARKKPNMTTHEPASSLGIKVGHMLLSL